MFPMSQAKLSASAHSSATIGFEAELWLAADKFRSDMDAAVASLFAALLPSLLDRVSNG